jgi:hypothetical protein
MSVAGPAVNPFCARRVRPGAVPFFFPDTLSPAALVRRLREAGWRGQVIGPHGSGKSTLLAGLRPHLEAAGRELLPVVRHGGERSLPAGFWERLASLGPTGLVVVDGYEQLGAWSRWRLWRACRRRGLGLLVTAHAGVGLPLIHRTAVTPELALRVVGHLTVGSARLVGDGEVLARLAARGGNLREALFELYDLHERRREDVPL